MALISPTLDNRTYEQLREELLSRIPVYAPEWTDHNESDPGIALLELFAYLGESLLYRFNQIPDTTRIEFLRLLGVQPRPAQPATVMLAATTELPAGVEVLRGSQAPAGSTIFETDDEVYVWPLDAVAAGKTPKPDEASAPSEAIQDALARAGVAAADAALYETTTVSADPLQPDPVTVEVSSQVDRALWVGLVAKNSTDLTQLRNRIVNVGVAFDEILNPAGPLAALDASEFRSAGLTMDPPAMLWRLWKGDESKPGDQAFTTLDVVRDTTKGLTQAGVVHLQLPADLPTLPATPSGGAGSPPPLTDAKLAANVVAWIQVCRPQSSDIGDGIGRVRWVGVNAIQATQAQTAAPELVGKGTGDADQRYPLNNSPILAGTVQLQVEETTGWETWQEVDTFASSTKEDRHFTVDRAAGAVSFGRARVPQIGQQIRAVSYRYGGGAAGNVAAKAITSVTGAVGVTVVNPMPASGGADTATLVDALDEIPAEVQRHDRAVVAADFKALAEQVAGVRRAEALSLLQPDTPAIEAAGVVSVAVFPDIDLRNPGAPLPELSLLRRVAAYLDARRLVTTELYVIPPEYVRIAVSAGIAVKDGYQVDAVRRWVELILRQFLAPVPPFGPDRQGWPMGRLVRRAELEAVAVQVDGVDYVQGLVLGTLDSVDQATQVDLVTLERWQVPDLAEIAVVSGDPLDLGAVYAPPPPPRVPVPVPPDVC
jgi:predicted phage baseplate assembly protein